MFGNIFCFLFSKTCFGEYKEKLFSSIFEIKNIFGYLNKKSFQKKGIENTKVYHYQNLNFNANLLNEIKSLN